MSQEDIGPYERVARKAVEDPEFRAALEADPRAALKDQMGIVVPESVDIELVQNSPGKLTLVLPHVVESADLDFEEEDQVVGFSYRDPNNDNLQSPITGPVLNSYYNGDFSKNFAPMGGLPNLGLRGGK